MDPASRLPDASTTSRLSSGLAVLFAVSAAAALLSPRPLADAFFAAWVVFAVGLAIVGAVGAWTRRTGLVWVAAVLLTGVAIVGIMSIGLYVLPAALALFGAAVASQLTPPRRGVHEAIQADPPSVLDAVLKTLGGTVAAVIGAGLVYEGTFVRELFTGGCARETLDCALAVTRWDAVALSVIGFTAVGVGGWLVWRQVAIGRALAARQA